MGPGTARRSNRRIVEQEKERGCPRSNACPETAGYGAVGHEEEVLRAWISAIASAILPGNTGVRGIPESGTKVSFKHILPMRVGGPEVGDIDRAVAGTGALGQPLF